MQNKVKIFNSNANWNEKKRYKINSLVDYVGSTYQNSTGSNSDPTLGLDWVVVKKLDVIPVVYHQDFIASGSTDFIVDEGILIQNVFLNSISVNGADWSQSGTTVTITTVQNGDLVTLTGRN